MRKVFKKVIAIATVVVFMCLCCINVSAYSLSEDYDSGRYVVELSASIYKYSTTGSIWVNDTTANTMLTDTYRYVSVTYNYIVINGTTPEVKTVTKTDTASSGDLTASVSASYSNSSIYQMVNATYTFKAKIPCSYGTQTFTPNSITLTYTS